MLRGKTPLLISVALGLTAGLVAYSAIRKKEADVRKGWNPIPVIVAARDLAEGTVLTVDDIQTRSVPEQFVTTSVVKPESASYVVGQKIQIGMQAGDPLLFNQLDTSRSNERLSLRLQHQSRSITIEAKGVAGGGGWVRPSDHVDIIGTFRDPDTGQQVSQILLQDIVVLAAGKVTGTTNVNLLSDSQRDYSSVSLLVIPEETEVLTLAQQMGTLTLALRAPDDPTMVAERGYTTIRTLLNGGRMKQLEDQRKRTIDVIRGNVTTKQAATP